MSGTSNFRELGAGFIRAARVVAAATGSARTLLITLAVIGWLAWAFCETGRPPGAPAGKHVLVISVDGMGANFYVAPPPNLHIPNLLKLKSEGSFAEGVVGVYPSVTYPSHTTIVTGKLPADHGVYSNFSSREPGKNSDDWFWFSKSIRATTLWEEARRAHLSTAAVSWPVTVGAAIDWNVPEIWEPGKEVMDLAYIAKFATPGLIQEALATLGAPPPGTDEDITRTHFAAYLLKKHQPNLLLVHLAALDGAEHQHGPQGSEASAALEQIDSRIGELLAAVKEASLESSTDVFIVSDHGFLPITREIRPNVLLVKAGILAADARGSVSGGRLATVSNGGSFFIYWSEAQDFREQVDRALKPLRDGGLLWGVFYRQALRDLGAEPWLEMALEAPEGATFGSQASGDLVTNLKAPGGTHGYLPLRNGLEASFIAWGPEIRAGVNLHRIRMTAIGPTILKALRIINPHFGDQPPLHDIFK